MALETVNIDKIIKVTSASSYVYHIIVVLIKWKEFRELRIRKRQIAATAFGQRRDGRVNIVGSVRASSRRSPNHRWPNQHDNTTWPRIDCGLARAGGEALERTMNRWMNNEWAGFARPGFRRVQSTRLRDITRQHKESCRHRCNSSHLVCCASCRAETSSLALVLYYFMVNCDRLCLQSTVYSELTACNPTLNRWLQHRYKQSRLCASRNNNHISHMPRSRLAFITYSGACW